VSSSSDMVDIAFIGHMCFDDIQPYQGAPGCAVLRRALAAALRPGFNPNPESLS